MTGDYSRSSKRTEPKISIGLPVYNGEDAIKKALDSIRSQTFRDFEVLISDDNSTDNTREICLKYCRKDPRFRYVRQKNNLTWPGNLEFVFKNTIAPYFACLSHDDYYKDKYFLENLYKRIGQGYDFVYPNVIKIVKVKDKPIKKLPRRSGKFNNSGSRFSKHLILIKNFYLGYQIFGLMRREKILNCFGLLINNIYYKRSSKNYLDEEGFLHFVFSRYNTYYEERVFLVKEMSESNYFKLNVLGAISPMFWNSVSVAGVIAQADYSSWQKCQLIIYKVLRSFYVLFDLCLKDTKRILRRF